MNLQLIFLAKANPFIDYVKERRRPIANDSSLPNNQTTETVTRLSDINIDTDTIIKLRSLDANKAHGCDGISIHIIKLCTASIAKPLHILFNKSVINVFQVNGKKQIWSQFKQKCDRNNKK